MVFFRSLVGTVVLLALGCSSSSDGGDNGAPPFVGGAPPGNMEQPAPSDPGLNGAAGAASTPVGPATGAAGSGEATPGDVTLAPATPPASDGASAPVAATPDAGGEVVTEVPPADGLPQPIAPSAGCGNGNMNQGAGALTIRGAQAAYNVRLPPGYSPDTPTPLVFGFHGRNRTHVEFETVDASNITTELGSRAIMVYLQSQGGPGWNFDAEVPPSIEFFDALYPQMFESYCVDLSRVYAVGHSSGGYFSIILACRYGSLLRGIGSVAGALQETACTDESVAAMFIHGATDRVVANSGGRAARDQMLARNACSQNTVPGAVTPCVAYQGCAEGFPVEWCEHTEPTYVENGQPTNHGWPSFASRAINQFFLSLP
jgi:poly(3-hydroxybutyrate) depolymerase